MTARRWLGAVGLAAALVLASCSDGDDAAPDPTSSAAAASTTTPPAEGAGAAGDDGAAGDGAIGADGVVEWSTIDPAEAGLDPAVLERMAAAADDADSYCLLVARHGRIAGEWYFGDETEHDAHEVFSVTKSFTSLLVGIAQDDGDLSITDPAHRWIPEWAGTDSSAVTVQHLLSNDSGRFWSLGSDYGKLPAAPDADAYAIGLEQAAPPETTWAYNNAAIQTLSKVIDEATGTPYPEFGAERILRPLGMDDSEFRTDPSGNGLAFMGLQSTCRDLGRFGQLLLGGGRWNGEEIVSEVYLAAATGQPSQDLNAAYGYLFWLNHRGPIAGATDPTSIDQIGGTEDGQLVADRPEDLVWAQGLGGQIVQVHAPTDTVVVRLGPGDLTATYGSAETAAVLDALED